MIGMLLRFPSTAKTEVRFREILPGLTPERAEEIRNLIEKAAANPSLFLGNDLSPWNNANLANGQAAQQALDLASKAASDLWPRFANLLAEAVREIGILAPATLSDAARLIELLGKARVLNESYGPVIFSQDLLTLCESLSPASKGVFARSWAYLSDSRYRLSRKQLRAIRKTKASARVLYSELTSASELVSAFRALGAKPGCGLCASCDSALSIAYADLFAAIEALSKIIKTEPFSAMPTQAVCNLLCNLAKDQRTPYKLPEVYDLRTGFVEAGLDRLIDDLRSNPLPPEQWVSRFDFIWLQSSLDAALASDPSLAAFNGRAHEKIVTEFCRLDRERVRLAAIRLRRLHAERALSAMNEYPDQTNLVRAEAAKKMRHIPIRHLLARAPDVLTRICPCWVASPLSVSQLLDSDSRHFDIVVFDEASQILQEEAIPALYRAGQVVVAGDRHQLPPTTFFATFVEGEDEIAEEETNREALATATEAIGGYDSILSTLESFLPNWMLEWHYRSEDERLITFSNTNIYSSRLITFPSANGQAAIRHILVNHDPAVGGQEESSSREVQEAVRQVLLYAKNRPNESLGVITMGIKHANRIQAALDRTLDAHPEFAEFFDIEREDRFFIKNLETVQGDERDAIILSVGYGKTSNGDLPHRFGPLTQDVGYRRLNVAVTRAKRRMLTISSFSADEIDLNRSGSRGVALLKAYLEYAASGGTRLTAPDDGEGELNAFEADVRDALTARGITTRPQYGASRYRIDLVAMHPRKPGRPVLAIECDGATYHSSATARDRDRLRQEHLHRLGWKFHRIWSTDWFYNREAEIERAVDAFKFAVNHAIRIDTGESLGKPVAPPLPTPTAAPTPDCRGPEPVLKVKPNIDEYSDGELLKLAKWITADGRLRTDEDVIQEIFKKLPFKKLGNRIRKRLTKIAMRVRPKSCA